jgi:putative flippase GtrA
MTAQQMALFERILRYGFAGGLVSVFFTCLVVLLVHVSPAPGPTWDNILAYILTQPVGYLIQRTITYPEADHIPAQQASQVQRFLVTNALGLVLTSSIMALTTSTTRLNRRSTLKGE